MVVVCTCKTFILSIVILTDNLVSGGEEVTKPIKAVASPLIRYIAYNGTKQIAAYSPTGVVYVYTMLRNKASLNRELIDQEKLAALQAYLTEKLQWGEEEPPGGWIELSWLKKKGESHQQRRQRSAMPSSEKMRKAWIEKRKAEGEKHFKTVYGHFKFIPKPGSEAEREFAKRAAPFMEQINEELADENAPWMKEVIDSPYVHFD